MRYSFNRKDRKVAGVCAELGERFGIDPTFLRIGFVAFAILAEWELALIAYVGFGIYFALRRKRAMQLAGLSDYDRMEEATRVRPTVHALRTELDDTDRRLMAIDDHINSTNDELAREIEALREEK